MAGVALDVEAGLGHHEIPLSPKTKSPGAPPAANQEIFGDLDGEISRLASTTRGSLKNMSLKQLYQLQWQKMQSWGSFMDTNRMKTPTSTMQWSRRLLKNLEHYHSNYLSVFLILVIYCILTSPLLLLAMAAALGACYIVTLRNAETPMKVFGYKLALGQQYLAISCLSFPLFYLAGAGSAVFWVIGASFFVIGLHASIYAIEMQDQSLEENLTPFTPPFSNIQTV